MQRSVEIFDVLAVESTAVFVTVRGKPLKVDAGFSRGRGVLALNRVEARLRI